MSVPIKARHLLKIFLVLFLAIGLRLSQLCLVQHEKIHQEVMKPRQKIFIEPAKRGGIYDRFGQTLASNKIQYQIGVFYPPIRQLPSVEWKKIKKSKKVKRAPRREYIRKLAIVLAEVLHKDPSRIEDLIHSKASLLFDAPLILSEDVSESQYYHLKKLENQWPGLYCGMKCKRFYPKGRVACHLLGYMGSISQKEFEAHQREREQLKRFLKDWQAGYFPSFPLGFQTIEEVRRRLKELSQRSYSLYDWVGKAGVEAQFDEELRGFFGKKIFYADAKGQFLRPLGNSKQALSGHRLNLTISAELQEYVEELLIENEKIREGRSIRINPVDGSYVYQKQPWLKGGAVVVMDPRSGELLAMASNPRFDPKDFVLTGHEEEKEEKNKNVMRWLENEAFIAQLWDQRLPLKKEVFNRRTQSILEEETFLSLELFLSFILPESSPVKKKLLEITDLSQALELQRSFECLLSLSGQSHAWNLLKVLYSQEPHRPFPSGELSRQARRTIEEHLKEQKALVSPYKRILDDYFKEMPSNYDKLLLVDLCRLLVDSRRFSTELYPYIQTINLSEHRKLGAAYFQMKDLIQKVTQVLYHDFHFKAWREVHQKSFLKEKRKEEKQQKKYPKPYLDYLDEEEKKQFHEFWETAHETLFEAFVFGDVSQEAHPLLKPYIEHFTLWAKEIQQGAYKNVGWRQSYLKLRELYQQWPSQIVTYYLRSQRSFKELDRPLLGTYRGVFPYKGALETDLAKSFYPKHGYSFTRSYAFAQATPQGSFYKLVVAYEALCQMWKKDPLNAPSVLNPLTMVDDLHPDPKNPKVWNVGFNSKGEPIPQMYKGGRLPRSHKRGIGALDLTEALARTSNPYFSLLAVDCIENPNDLNRTARHFSFGQKTGLGIPGEIAGSLPKDLECNPTGLYAYAIGQHTLVVTPLQTALMLSSLANGGVVFKPQLIQSLQGVSLKKSQRDLLSKAHFKFEPYLHLLGIDFPLFLGEERGEAKHSEMMRTRIHHQIELPYPVKNTLFLGMKKAVSGAKGTAKPERVKSYRSYHPLNESYMRLKNQIIGKTSSAEVREVVDLDLDLGVNTYKHTWFAGLVFEEDIQEGKWPEPELVVVVYLRYGDFGREAAPLVAGIAEKWRKIKKKQMLLEEERHNDEKE